MRRIISLAVVVVLLLSLMPALVNAEAVTKDASKTMQEVLLNGEKVELGAYLIEGRNYVKLRDAATLLSATDSKFNVGFDNEKKVVLIKTGEAYEKQEKDMMPLEDGVQKAMISERPFVFNGEEKMVMTAVINKNNYLQLRQLGELIGFGVNFNEETKAIELSTVAKKEKPEPKLEEQKAIDLSGFKGEWISIHSILGDLKTFVKTQAEALKITEKEVIAKYEESWSFPAKSFKVEGNKITFKMNDDKEVAGEYKHAGFIPRIRDGKVVSYLHLFETETKDAPKYFATTEVHFGHAHLYYLGNEKPEKFEGKISIATVLPSTMKIEEMDEMLTEHMSGHSKKEHKHDHKDEHNDEHKGEHKSEEKKEEKTK